VAGPLGQLPTRAGPDRQLAVVERHKHRVQARGGRPAAALADGVDGALADGLGVAGGHAKPVAGEGLAQRRPGGAQLGGGGVDAAQLLGELEGAFGLGAVGEEAAGLPAQLVVIASVSLHRSASSYVRVLSEANVEQDAAVARMRLRPA
jgi:hypothetical protein